MVRTVLAVVVASLAAVCVAMFIGYHWADRQRQRRRAAEGANKKKTASAAGREGFALNEQGVDLTCTSLRGNVNRFGYTCGLPSSVVAHWKFDAIAPDGSVYDLSTNMLHLRKHGDPQLRYDGGRTAVWLDGERDHFTLKTSRKFMRGVHDGFSLSFWYKQTERGPSHYEPFVLLHRGERSFVAVTDHWSDHRVDIKTNAHNWLATTRPRDENEGQWTHCVAVFHPDRVRLVLSRERLGDVDDRAQDHALSEIDYANFDNITVGAGPGWVIPSRTVRPVRGYLSDMRVHARALGEEEMAMLLHMTAKTGREVVSDLEVKGDAQIGGNANVQHRLHFRDPKMDPSYNWKSNNSDTYFFEKKEHGRNRSSLDLTINDDPGERFRILGNSCREGPAGCSGPGVPQHEFRADGRAYHKGDVVAGGEVQADAFRFRDGRSGFEDDGNGGIRVRTDRDFDVVHSRDDDGSGGRRAFRFDAENDRFCIGGQCMGEGDVRKMTSGVHEGDFRATGSVRADGGLFANGNLDVRNPGGGRGGRDGGRLHTFYRDASTHLSLEELDDNVYYDMKTHKNGDVASLMKTRHGDVYLRNRAGHIKLGRDGTVEDSGRRRLCIGGTCITEDDLRKLKGAGDLSNLEDRFASRSRVSAIDEKIEEQQQPPDKPEFVGARGGNFNTSGNPRGNRGDQYFCEEGWMPSTDYRVVVENRAGRSEPGDLTLRVSGSMAYKKPHVFFYTPKDKPVSGKAVLQAKDESAFGWKDVKTIDVDGATRLKFGCVDQP